MLGATNKAIWDPWTFLLMFLFSTLNKFLLFEALMIRKPELYAHLFL